MTRKQKIDYLKSIASGTSKKTFGLGDSYYFLLINADGTDVKTGKPPTPERIEEVRNCPFSGGYLQFTDGTEHPDWAEIYGLKKLNR